VGETPVEMLEEFGRASGIAVPKVSALKLASGDALVWNRARGEPPFVMRIEPSRTERRRHTRKYAEGELPPDRSFYFRGPQKKLNLRAHNLIIFLQMGDGVDDETWAHHLQRGEYSNWMRECIKDPELASEVEAIERSASEPAESRKLIREAIERRYTLPADKPDVGSDAT
jgi:hypothetical protein